MNERTEGRTDVQIEMEVETVIQINLLEIDGSDSKSAGQTGAKVEMFRKIHITERYTP